MKYRPALIVGGLIAAVAVLALGYWLVSPLFRDDTVNEAFPFTVPNTNEMADMTDEEKADLEAEFIEAVPDEADLVDLSDEEVEMVEEAVAEAAASVMTDKEMEDPMPEDADAWLVVASGSFANGDDFHQGSGSATIYQQGDQRVLRFEDFNVTNGPDLHVILSPNPNPSGRSDIGDYIDLGQLKGNMGDQNYDIPADVDLSQYQSIVIYCVPFHVLFSVATLN